MEWLNQDEVIKKIESEMNCLRNAAFIAEKGMEAVKTNTREGIEKHAEFKVREVDYNRFADFLEEVLLDINLMKEEEIRQLEEAEEELRGMRIEAHI